jgi:hypothetical protein
MRTEHVDILICASCVFTPSIYTSILLQDVLVLHSSSFKSTSLHNAQRWFLTSSSFFPFNHRKDSIVADCHIGVFSFSCHLYLGSVTSKLKSISLITITSACRSKYNGLSAIIYTLFTYNLQHISSITYNNQLSHSPRI